MKVVVGETANKERMYAIKIVYKSVIERKNCFQALDSELSILKRLEHPNIVKFHKLLSDKKRYCLHLSSTRKMFSFLQDSQKKISSCV